MLHWPPNVSRRTGNACRKKYRISKILRRWRARIANTQSIRLQVGSVTELLYNAFPKSLVPARISQLRFTIRPFGRMHLGNRRVWANDRPVAVEPSAISLNKKIGVKDRVR